MFPRLLVNKSATYFKIWALCIFNNAKFSGKEDLENGSFFYCAFYPVQGDCSIYKFIYCCIFLPSSTKFAPFRKN
jgi:hypothetical protein